MPDVPAAAVAAALAKRADLLADRPDPMVLSEETLTRLMLEAAAPEMAAAVARKITAHMDDRWPSGCVGSQPARRHFRTAAQIAALAFFTGDDMKRIAAEALRRGEFVACDLPEDRQ